MDYDPICSWNSLLKGSLPFVLFSVTLTWFIFKRWESRNDKKVDSQFDIFFKYRKWIQLLLIPFEIAGWIYIYIHGNHCNISPISFALSYGGLFILVLTAPNSIQFKTRHYIYTLFITYAITVIQAGVSLLTITQKSHIEGIWEWVHFSISLVLAIIIGTTPHPINPLNLDITDDEKLEFKMNLRICPESTASILSWASFQWVNPLVIFGFRNKVTRDDIYSLTFHHLARFAYGDFVETKKWTARKNLVKRMYNANKSAIWLQFIFSSLAVSVSYLSPFFQQKLLEYIEDPKGRPIQTAYGFVFGMFSVTITKLLCNNIQLYAGRRWNVRTLCMLDAEIYEKTLKRKDMSGKVDDKKKDGDKDKDKDDSVAVSGTGKITNLMSIDADRIGDLPSYIFMFYNAPLELFIAITYLYNLLGVAAFVGLGVMVSFFPVSWFLVKRIGKAYEGLSNAKDKRNELVNELLQGIRMIKYFAWEKNWREKVQEVRKKEVNKLVWTVTYDVLLNIAFLAIPVLVTASSFIWYTKVAGNELTASVVFVSITLFDMLRAPIILIPDSVSTFTECYVSLKRIVTYLEEPEVGDGIENPPIKVADDEAPEQVIAKAGFEASIFQWHVGTPSEAKDSENNTKTNNESDDTTTTENSSASSSASSNNDDATLNERAADKHQSFSLKLPELFFPIGELSLICGPTGAGKTSILYALLGEMDIVSGRAYLPTKNKIITDRHYSLIEENTGLNLDKVAYVPQQAYLQHATIRDNILFGLPFDPVRYKKVLQQCALIKDLNILTDGDFTEIGEKGISLSGGQKQRVSLARAVYSYAKTIILDDCLSAVDTHTAKHIFENCISGDLLKGRTIILVTHHVRLCLPAAKYLVKIEKGNIAGHGYVETLKENNDLIRLLGEEAVISEDNSDEANKEQSEVKLVDEDEDYDITKSSTSQKLVAEEESARGRVKFEVYKTYFDACGGWPFWMALVFAYVISRFITFGETWWLRIWAASYAEPKASLMTVQDNFAISTYQTLTAYVQNTDVNYYISIYILLCFSFVIFDTFRSVLLYWGSIRGAKSLFNQLLDRIMYAPMRFFDTTPIGRILNRFGKDVVTVDIRLARSASFLLECTTGLIQSIIVISVITPQFLITALIISGVYFLIGTFYLRISRELKRLNSVSRSPIYSHFTESIVGVTTIRAYGGQKRFLLTMYEKLDSYVAPFYLLWMTNRWLYCRIEFTGAFVTLSTGIFILLNIDRIDAGMAGISLFYASSFLVNVYWFIRQYTQVEMDLNSVERIQEYLLIDQEAPSVVEGRRPPAAWPTTAAVEVKDLEIRYAPDLPTVIRGISFDIKPHEKIAVVGKTASGKSTLALSFFRFLEPSSGSISMDGIDITQIGLEDLRSKITIIPQEATLFSGTIRSNLDPFDEHDDTEIWNSLIRSHLANPNIILKKQQQQSSPSTSIQDLSNADASDDKNSTAVITSLDQPISDGGANFSQGQKQLLCLSRALLKNSKLIIMDEATASVDFETDSKIQITIREEFSNSTIITIAHRIRSIIDYDRVLVLDHGKIIEYDAPYTLLQNKNGVFRSMCEKSGELDILEKLAEESKNGKNVIDDLVVDNHSLVK
ncbi:unnamed protein product [Cunninghamella blakesleeana]